MTEKRPLHVRDRDSGHVVHTVEASPHNYDRVMMGMLMNMDTERFFIDDSAFDEPDNF